MLSLILIYYGSVKFHESLKTDVRELYEPERGDLIDSPLFFVPPSNVDRNYAFSYEAKQKIHGRAGRVCELSGETRFPKEAAHLNHSRKNKYYDHPGNGLLVTDIMHLAHHMLFVGNAEAIGLTENGNSWAVGQLERRVLDFRLRGGFYQPETAQQELHRDLLPLFDIWLKFYGEFEG